MMRNTRRLTIATAACLIVDWAGGGCASNLNFNSPSPLGSGVLGKTWQTPYFVDSGIYLPVAMSRSTTLGASLANDFAIAAYGSTAQITGAWWDSSTISTYKGYSRLYQDGVGWAGLGPSYGQVAVPPATSFGFASLAAGPGGLFVASLFDTANGSSAAYTGSSWQPAVNTALGGNVPGGANVTTAVDSVGRGFVFYSTGAAVLESQWGLVSGLTASVNTVLAGAIRANSALTSRFDGIKQVCVTYETGASALNASCSNVSAAGPFTFATTTTIAASVAGHDSATDGAGNIMLVFYKGTHVYASLGANAVWPATATQLDVGLGDGFVAPTQAQIAGVRPGVASIGNGKFIAIWVGINTTLSPPATQLYSDVYDPANGGWQAVASPSVPASLQAIPGTIDYYNTVPHARSLAVFGNNYGNAGYALNKIRTTDYVPSSLTPAGYTSIYPEAAQARVTELNRWQQDNSWVGQPPATFANYNCYNQSTTATAVAVNGSGSGADCTHAPVGVILPSGDTIVLFQAQDNYSQAGGGGTTIPGNRRVAAVEFR